MPERKDIVFTSRRKIMKVAECITRTTLRRIYCDTRVLTMHGR